MYTNIKTLDVSTQKHKLTNISFTFDHIDYLVQAASESNVDKIVEALNNNINFKVFQRKLIMANEKLYALYDRMVLK